MAHTLSWNIFKGAFVIYVTIIHQCYDDTLDSRIDVGQEINVGPWKFGKKNSIQRNKMCKLMLKKKSIPKFNKRRAYLRLFRTIEYINSQMLKTEGKYYFFDQ